MFFLLVLASVGSKKTFSTVNLNGAKCGAAEGYECNVYFLPCEEETDGCSNCAVLYAS